MAASSSPISAAAPRCARFIGGRSIESTMGFTALDGLPMGTRPGQIDPGVILYLIAVKGMTTAEVQDLLYRDCGLKGLSGISNDMRELQGSSDPNATFAIDYFVYRAALNAGNAGGRALGGSTPSSSPPASAKTRTASARALPSGSDGSASRSTARQMPGMRY